LQASAVAYLAGPEAHYITGINWDVDGGYAVCNTLWGRSLRAPPTPGEG